MVGQISRTRGRHLLREKSRAQVRTAKLVWRECLKRPLRQPATLQSGSAVKLCNCKLHYKLPSCLFHPSRSVTWIALRFLSETNSMTITAGSRVSPRAKRIRFAIKVRKEVLLNLRRSRGRESEWQGTALKIRSLLSQQPVRVVWQVWSESNRFTLIGQ